MGEATVDCVGVSEGVGVVVGVGVWVGVGTSFGVLVAAGEKFFGFLGCLTGGPLGLKSFCAKKAIK